MKKIFVLLSCALLTVGAGAQGTINFVNVSTGAGVSAYVNRSDDLSPAGRLGAGYWAQLYVGVVGTVEDSLTAVGVPVQFRNNAITGAPVGSVNGGTVEVSFLRGWTPTVVQMRAWKLSAGATYEAARATGLYFGQSNPITVVLGDPNANPPYVPADLVGLQPFTVLVPEPSTIALAAVGVAVMLLRRHGH